MDLKTILIESINILQTQGIEHARYECELIISHYLEIPRGDLYFEFDKKLDKHHVNEIQNAVKERSLHKPLQYILGSVYFLEYPIIVNENVLIPRPETEFMVDLVIKHTTHLEMNEESKSQNTTVLDLCTGSGAIAIALKKKLPFTTIYATDICEKALEVANSNAKMNDCEIYLLQSDLFEVFSEINKSEKHFDIIISNPPYISEQDYQSLAPELFFEPKKALIAGNNGFGFIIKIIEQAKKFLKKEGLLYLEIGYNQAKEIKKIVKEMGYSEFTIYKDMSGKQRIVRLRY